MSQLTSEFNSFSYSFFFEPLRQGPSPTQTYRYLLLDIQICQKMPSSFSFQTIVQHSQMLSAWYARSYALMRNSLTSMHMGLPSYLFKDPIHVSDLINPYFFRVLEHLICLIDRFEFLCKVGIAIRMEFLCQFVILCFYLLLRCTLLQIKYFIGGIRLYCTEQPNRFSQHLDIKYLLQTHRMILQQWLYLNYIQKNMAQTLIRSQPQFNSVSPASIKQYSIHQIISMDPILSQYFKSYSNSDTYWKLAHDLMLDGIRYRATSEADTRMCCCRDTNIVPIAKQGEAYVQNKNQSPQRIQQNQRLENVKSPSNSQKKHYNVAYVKHNRFLSPSQKKQLVTPKVTEVIPSKSPPLVIYGKPRVKADNDFGCPYHINEQQCLRSIPYGGPCEPNRTPRQLKNTQYEVHVLQKQNPNMYIRNSQQISQPQMPGNQLSRYKSTPNLNNIPQNYQDLNKTKKNGQSKINQQSRSKSKSKPKKQLIKTNNKNNQRTKFENPGTTIYVERIVQVESRIPGKMRVVKSPKNRPAYAQEEESYQTNNESYLAAKYNQKNLRPILVQKTPKQAESKIKFLIERDKMNKALQKNLIKQEKRIAELQSMMEKAAKSKKQTIKISSNDIISLSSSSNSQMSMMDTGIINKFKKKSQKHQLANTKSRENRQQHKNNRNVGSAHFGIQESSQFEGSQDLDCSCSKTFNEDNSQDDNNDLQDIDSSFSDFQK